MGFLNMCQYLQFKQIYANNFEYFLEKTNLIESNVTLNKLIPVLSDKDTKK